MGSVWHSWKTLPDFLSLNPAEAHIWKVNLEQAAHYLDCLSQLLTPDEWERANRFKLVQPRQQFVASRSILRLLLSRYLQIQPDQVQFCYSDRGKPALPNTPLQFNLSHSHGLALYAFTLNYPVGIDVEQCREIQQVEKLAQRFLSDVEHQAIVTLAPEQQSFQFLQYWTCREAYLKAIGEGLVGLESLQIRKREHTPEVWLLQGTQWRLAPQWYLSCFEPDWGYCAALAVEASGLSISYRSMDHLSFEFFRGSFL